MDNQRLLRVIIKQGFSFSFLKESDIDLHKEFIKRNWPASTLKSDYNYNKWKFGDRGNGEINIIVCKKDNNIVGQFGLIPLKIVIRGQVYQGFWGCNFKIDDIYKDIGLGAAIDIFAIEHYPMIMATSPSDESAKYKKRLGWLSIKGSAILFFPIKIKDLLKIKKMPAVVGKAVDVVSYFVDPLWACFLNVRLRMYKENNWSYTNQETIVDKISNRKTKLKVPYILHDKTFLDWRTKPPEQAKKDIKYLISDQNQSYAIYSVIGKIIYIFEHYYETKKDIGSFIKFLIKKEKNRDTGLLKIYANSESELRLFKSFSFIPLRTPNEFFVYSQDNLFSGINNVHIDIYDGDGILA